MATLIFYIPIKEKQSKFAQNIISQQANIILFLTFLVRVGKWSYHLPTIRTNLSQFLATFRANLPLRLPAGGAFFSLLAQRKEPKERAAAPLRRPRSVGFRTGGAKTRCAQTVCPFAPVLNPTERLSADGSCRLRNWLRGLGLLLGGMISEPTNTSMQFDCFDRSHVPASKFGRSPSGRNPGSLRHCASAGEK